MKRFVLKNGLTLLLKQRPTNSVAVEVTVKVGSNYEPLRISGVSHFIEHMLFESTKKRTAQQIANEIEKIGGEINAFTNNEKTSYYIVVLHKHLERALDVLSDIIQNPLFDEKVIEKERKVILDEISITTDDPKVYQWILFQKLLYKKHPCRHPVYGTKKSVLGLKKKDFLDFYYKYYVPNNIIISIVGNVDERILKMVENFFTFPSRVLPEAKPFVEPKQTKPLKLVEKRKIMHSYLVFGYRAVPRGHPDSFVFDVIRSVLGRGQSSKLFNEIRTKRGLAYSLGVYYDAGSDYGWLAVYVGMDKKNIQTVKDIILKEFRHLRRLSAADLKDAITFIEGDYILSNENNYNLADVMSVWELTGLPSMVEDYVKNIKKIKKKDIKRVVNNYFKNPAYVIIKQA
ncbi:MAG: pitrilysin family protein [Nanoarchaeota archaeon]|nr:pitrilysin family protein [Nanoarchaeota archaeon]